MPDATIPKLALPLNLVNGSLATVEQDSVDDVAKCCETVVRYEQEYLPFLPTFGIPPALFRQATETLGPEILAALGEWEPRADTVLAQDDIEDLVRSVQIGVTTREPG